MSPYETFKEAQAALEQNLASTAKALGDVPGIASGPMGLTPDNVRATPEYRSAKAAYEAAFAALRAFNGKYIKVFRNEIRAERNERLKSKAKEN